MELNFNFSSYSAYPPQGNASQDAVLYSQANRLFWHSYLWGQLRRLWAWICRRPSRLPSLDGKGSRLTSACYAGCQEVPLSAIRGTENRTGDFDAAFHPLRPELRQRWVHVALAFLQGRGLPPVELVRLGDDCFVRDGHHRVSVARACQQLTIDASVTNWKVKAEPQPCTAACQPGFPSSPVRRLSRPPGVNARATPSARSPASLTPNPPASARS